MIPQTTGDVLDILDGLFHDLETGETRRMYAHIKANLAQKVRGDGLIVEYSTNDTRHILMPDPERQIGR